MLDHGANFFIAGSLTDDAVAKQNAASVGIYDKHRMIAGVEQDRVGGFRANTIEFQQLCSEFFSGLGEHACERAGISLIEKSDEGLQISRFLAEVARGSYQSFEFIVRSCAHGADAESAGEAQVDHGFLYVAPVGVLREVSADDHFKA